MGAFLLLLLLLINVIWFVKVKIMKFKKETFPNEDIIEIHTNKDLSKYAYSQETPLEDMGMQTGDLKLANAIKKINGVASVDIADSDDSKFKIRITKGAVFNWRSITPKVIEATRKIVSPRSKTIILPTRSRVAIRG